MSENNRLSTRNAKIAAMLADGEQLKNFYRFIAQNPYINLHDACQIIIERPDATVCNTMEDWNAMGRRVTKGKKGIPYYDNDGYKRFVFDAADTHGDDRFQRDIIPLKHILIGLDELNGTSAYEDGRGEYRKIHNGVYSYLERQGELTGDEQRDALLAEGITFLLYSKTGFPKMSGVHLHGLPYSYRDNADFVKELYIRSTILTQEIEEAYEGKQAEVEVIDDTEEETITDEPVITNAPVEHEEIAEQEERAEENIAVSPIYGQYLDAQKINSQAIVVMRLGDFYEIMGENAVKVADELDLTLTGRNVGLPERVPMCGFPYHVAEKYIEKILERHGVLLAEEGQEPKYILSHAEALGQGEPENKQDLIEIPDEQSPFDDEQSEEIEDGEQEEEWDDFDAGEEVIDEDFNDEPEQDEIEEEAKSTPKKKDEKGIQDRKRKSKPQLSMFDLLEPQGKSEKDVFIDECLTRASSNNKVKFYDAYMKNLTLTEFAKLLKDTYGISGSYGGGLDREFNSKGALYTRRDKQNPENELSVHLKWPEVAERIAELIEADEYLSQSEKSEYARIVRIRNERAAAKTDDERCEVIANQIVEYGTKQTYSKTFSEYPHFLEDYAKFYFDHSEEIKQKLLARKEVASVGESSDMFDRYLHINFHIKYCPRWQARLRNCLNRIHAVQDFADSFIWDCTDKFNPADHNETITFTVTPEDIGESNYLFIKDYRDDFIEYLQAKPGVESVDFSMQKTDIVFKSSYIRDLISGDELRPAEHTKLVRDIADKIIKEGTQNTTEGNWVQFFSEFGENEIFVSENSVEITEELERHQEVSDVELLPDAFDTNFYLDYCPNYIPKDDKEEYAADVDKADPTVAADNNAVKVGDKFSLNGREWEVKGFDGLYPEQAVITRTEQSGNLVYDVTQNIDISELLSKGQRIKPEQGENTDLSAVLDQTELGGAKTRFKNNVAAIRLVNKLYAENRNPTAEEQKTLSQFVGWGGLAQAFDEKNESWKKEYAELKSLLSTEDYEQARSSTLNAYYTAKDVIEGIYSALNRFGVKGNNRILEPAMGTGNFFGFMPKEIAEGSGLYGVELDNLTGRIAAKLYPQANVQIKGFEDTTFPNDKFDIVVGNVPFGGYGVADSDYNRYNFKVHDYFLAKSVDKVKPGGIVAIITSKGTIPEREIAYIHEANTDEQKQALFDRVNSGAVRVLIGSTEKCGAGTNVQKRLVALHHLDTPYRPSDMEQREGRIIRQGNTNDKVKIFIYVTERTFDSYSYQILENKQRFISQINRGDLTIREAEDIDETTLSYAEIKAITAANPKIKRKMEVDAEVARLRVLEGQYRKNLYALQDKIYKNYPEDIRKQELYIERVGKDLEMLKSTRPTNPEDFSINVNGKVYTDKKEGGKAFLDALYSGKVNVPVAEYCGFKISMNPMYMLGGEREITLAAEGQYVIPIGDSAFGTLTRLENFLSDLPEREARLKKRLAQLNADLEVAKEQAEKPFEQAEQLKTLLSEQAQLNAELNLDKRDEVIVADENDSGDGDNNYRALPDIRKRNMEVNIIDEEDKVASMKVELLPDYAVTNEDMHAYGYTWDGMLPLTGAAAKTISKLGITVYELTPTDNEYEVKATELFDDKDKLFGVEKPDWNAFIQSDKGRDYIAARREVVKSIFTSLDSEDMQYFSNTERERLWEQYGTEVPALDKALGERGIPSNNILKRYAVPVFDEQVEKLKAELPFEEHGWSEADIHNAVFGNVEIEELKEVLFRHSYETRLNNFLDKELAEFRYLNGRTTGFTEDEIVDISNDLKPAFENSEFVSLADGESYDHWYDGFVDDELMPLLQQRLEPVRYSSDGLQMPDQTITEEDLRKYGYKSNDVLPLRRQRAEELFKDGFVIHILSPKDGKWTITEPREFDIKKDVLFGVGRNQWYDYCERNGLLNWFKDEKEEREANPFDSAQQYEDNPLGLPPLDDELTVLAVQPDIELNENRTIKGAALLKNEVVDGYYVLGFTHDGDGNTLSVGDRTNLEKLGVSPVEIDPNIIRTFDSEQEARSFYDERVKVLNSLKENYDREEPDYEEEVKNSVDAEFEAFKSNILTRPPEEIFYNNYKIHVFTELKEVIETGSESGWYLDPEHYRALYEERGSILHELYDDFLGEEFASINTGSDTAEFIKDYCECYHSAVMSGQTKMPVYLKTSQYALVHNEFGQYQTSRRLTEECRNAIDKVISENYDGMHLRRGFEMKLIDEYGEERVKYIFATTLRENLGDGRYSPENKGWAENIPISESPEERRSCCLNSHPAVIDGVVRLIRRYEQLNKNVEEIMQYQTNAEQQNKEENSLAENKFLTETSRGDKVLSIAQDRSGRNVAVVQRKNDYTVAIGYDTTDGTWAQGVYDFKDEKAANDYREKYYGKNSEPQEKWYEIFVSKDALIKRYNKSSLMRMPSSNKEYADYSYYIFNNRIKESRQLVDMQSDSRELCYKITLNEGEVVNLRNRDGDEVELTAEEFAGLVNHTSDKDYERKEREYIQINLPKEALIKEYEKASLFMMPTNSKYKGYSYYLPNSVVRENAQAEDGSLTAGIAEDFTVTLRKDKEEIKISAQEFKGLVGNTNDEDYKREPTAMDEYREQQKDDGKAWSEIALSEKAVIAAYEKSSLIRMPKGKYEGMVYYIPSGMVRKDENGLRLRLPEDFEVHLKGGSDEKTDLTAQQLMEELAGKRDEDYESIYRRPSEEARKKFEEIETNLRSSLPDEMRNKSNWVVVRTRENNDTGRLEKFLIDVHTGKFAESDNPKTWTDFDSACKYAKEHGGVALAYALDGKDGIACIDLDKCIGEDGKRTPLAEEVLSKCGKTYIEHSLSGKGLHIFGRTKCADLRSFSKDGDMEYYQGGQFIAMTGDGTGFYQLGDFDTPEMKALLERKLERRTEWTNVGKGEAGLTQMDDRELLEKAFSAKNGDTVRRLYNGEDLRHNHSNSDMSLMNYLAFYSGGNVEQMTRIFATSGLYRPEKDASYYEHTAIKAAKDTPHYTPPKAPVQPPKSSGGNSKA